MNKKHYETLLNLFNNRSYIKAEEFAEDIISSSDADSQFYLLLGVIQIQLKKYKKGILSLKHCIKLKPNSPGAYNNLGIIYGILEDHKTAIEHYKEVIKYQNNNFQAYYNLGNASKAIGNIAEAETAYRESIKIQPNNLNAFINLGVILHENKRYDEAVIQFKKALKLDPNSAIALSNIGNSLVETNMAGEALVYLKKSIKIDSENFNSYSIIGNAYKNMGDLENAIKYIKQSINLKPDFAENYFNLGNCYNHQGDIESALNQYKLALEKKPSLLFVIYNIGMIFFKINEYEKALNFFKESRYGDYEERILLCLYNLKQFKEFNIKLEEITKRPNDSRLVASLAAHSAINFDKKIEYNFCKNPLDFIYKEKIDKNTSNNLKEFIKNNNIDYRHQPLLHNAEQSAGNIFAFEESIIKELEIIIFNKVEKYKEKFKNENCEYIKKWPIKRKVRGWSVKMKKDGFLKPHIHEGGWLSGVIYLELPEKNNDEGMIAFGLDGQNYPKLHNDFPIKVEHISEGDIILFPSSLFHRTIPFKDVKERLCIAFDINP